MTVLDQLDDVLGQLADASLSGGDDLVRLHRSLARLEAIATQATAGFDASRAWFDDGAKTAAAWIRTRCRVPDRVAKRRVRLGRALPQLPHAEAAWLAGDITGDHVSLLAAARTGRTAEVLARDEARLVDEARDLRFADFQRLVCYWRQLADPDGEEDRAAKQVEDRRLDLSQTFQGSWVGDLVLDPISGAILNTTLKVIEDELFHTDWAEAKQRLGRDPLAGELARTPGQRRADALVEMAVRARTAPHDGKRPAPLFTVLVGYETFAGRVCELANRTVVTPGTLVPPAAPPSPPTAAACAATTTASANDDEDPTPGDPAPGDRPTDPGATEGTRGRSAASRSANPPASVGR